MYINSLFDFTLETCLFKFQYLSHRWGLELTCLITGDYSNFSHRPVPSATASPRRELTRNRNPWAPPQLTEWELGEGVQEDSICDLTNFKVTFSLGYKRPCNCSLKVPSGYRICDWLCKNLRKRTHNQQIKTGNLGPREMFDDLT